MSLPPPLDDYVGEPDYPSPWTTDRPREGLRDTDAVRIVCLAPDVCLTPVGSSVVPVPYQIVDYGGHDRNYTPSVRFTGLDAMVLRSETTHVHGDAPGTRKGVKSGTVEDVCEPIGHAAQVRAEGSPVIRHLDRFHMNRKNTVGEAIFVRNTNTYPAPQDDHPGRGAATYASQSEIQRSGVWGDNAEPTVQLAQAWVLPRGPLILPRTTPLPRPLLRPVPAPRPVPRPAPAPGPSEPTPQPQTGPRPPLPGPTVDPDPGSAPRPAPRPGEDPGDDVRVDEQCPVTIICFLPRGSHNRDEYRRQLKMQEAQLNRTTIAGYQANRSAFTSSVTGPQIRRQAANARNNYRSQLRSRLHRQHGTVPGEIEYQRQIWGQDALHRLDTVAGGNPSDIARLGGSAENQHIGRSWVGPENPEASRPSQTRVGKLDEHARYLQRRGCTMMRAVLEVCEIVYTYPPEIA